MLSLMNPSTAAPGARPAIAADPLGGGLRADASTDAAEAGGFAGALQRSADALQGDGAADAAPGRIVARRALAAADARRAAAGRAPTQDVEPPPADDDGTATGLADDCALPETPEPRLADTPAATALPLPAPLPPIDPDISRAAGLLPTADAAVPTVATEAAGATGLAAVAAAAGAVPAGASRPVTGAATPAATRDTLPAVASRAAEQIAAGRHLPDAAPPKALPAPVDPLPRSKPLQADGSTPPTPVDGRTATSEPAPAAATTVEPIDRQAAAATASEPAPAAGSAVAPPVPETAPAPASSAMVAPMPTSQPTSQPTTEAIAPPDDTIAPPTPNARPMPAGIGALRAAATAAPSTTPGLPTTGSARGADQRAGEPVAARGPARAPRADAATDRFNADAAIRGGAADTAPVAGRSAPQEGRDGAAGGERFAAPAASQAAAAASPALSSTALPRFADQLQAMLAPAPSAAATPAPSFADAPTYTLPASPQSPEFAPAMGAQISLLARDGVQQARIELNPVDLGPVLVQISLDGQAARIDFHAEVASTRQAIEASLPTLAGSLRDAGMTLAGGGVFQQPQQQSSGRQGAEDGGRRGPGGSRERGEDGPAAATAVRATTRRGLVDLVA